MPVESYLTTIIFQVNILELTNNGILIEVEIFMQEEDKELERVTVIKNELGLHARSAAQIAAVTRTAKGNVWIEKDDRRADASSIMDILTLICERGTTIRIIIEDIADIHILNAIVDLVENGFGE